MGSLLSKRRGTWWEWNRGLSYSNPSRFQRRALPKLILKQNAIEQLEMSCTKIVFNYIFLRQVHIMYGDGFNHRISETGFLAFILKRKILRKTLVVE